MVEMRKEKSRHNSPDASPVRVLKVKASINILPSCSRF